MKVFFHNFNPSSNSGPNKFTRHLTQHLVSENKIEVVGYGDHDVEFAVIQQNFLKKMPLLLRLDGIYFNSKQNFEEQNRPIKYSYDNAECVVFQSNFNKLLIEKWFGKHNNSKVIHNGADFDFIKTIDNTCFDSVIDENTEVWSCASSWRPHKRLSDNLRFFYEKANNKAIMLVAGKDIDLNIINEFHTKTKGRVFAVGELSYEHLISLYKRSTKFVHLAYLDHCPNVVVDAQASGCHIICSSSGGTHEIVTDGTIVNEELWNFEPIDLYNPPILNFNDANCFKQSTSKDISLKESSQKYLKALKEISQ